MVGRLSWVENVLIPRKVSGIRNAGAPQHVRNPASLPSGGHRSLPRSVLYNEGYHKRVRVGATLSPRGDLPRKRTPPAEAESPDEAFIGAVIRLHEWVQKNLRRLAKGEVPLGESGTRQDRQTVESYLARGLGPGGSLPRRVANPIFFLKIRPGAGIDRLG
jgi:hypothetical protein